MNKCLVILSLLFGSFFAATAQGTAPGVPVGASIGVVGGQALLGSTSITLSGATYTMAATEWWAGTLVLTGSPSAAVTLIAPLNPGQKYAVINKTSVSVTIQGASGTGVTIAPSGSYTGVVCDGVNYVTIAAASGSGSTVPSPKFQLPFYSATGTASTLTGDSGITTDGSGNLTAKSIVGMAQITSGFTFAQAYAAGFLNGTATPFAGTNLNPCQINHGVYYTPYGGMNECFNGSLPLGISIPQHVRTYYGGANQQDVVFCGDTLPGKSLGNTQHNEGGSWHVSSCIQHGFFTSSMGIKQLEVHGMSSTGIGDTTFDRWFISCSSGATAASDEGCKGHYTYMNENPSYYGNLDSTATTGASSINAPNGQICGSAQIGIGSCYGQGRWAIRDNAPIANVSLVSIGQGSFSTDWTATVSGTALTPNPAYGTMLYTGVVATNVTLTRATGGAVTTSGGGSNVDRMKYAGDTYIISGCSDTTFNGTASRGAASSLNWQSTTTTAGTCTGATVTLTNLPDTDVLTPDTIYVGNLAGTSGAFRSSGVACISSTNAESVAYTSTAVSGGIQALVVQHRYPMDVNATVSDGACKLFSADADFYVNQYSHAVYVVTNITSPTTFTWQTTYLGNRSGGAFALGNTGWVSKSVVTAVNLVRTAGSSTATMTWNSNISGGDQGFIRYGPGTTFALTGCSDSTMNGNFTVAAGTLTPTRSLTFTSSGTTASTCTASSTITGKDTITLWSGARVWNTQDPNVVPTMNSGADPRQSGWMGLEANETAWQPGEQIEVAKNPNIAYTVNSTGCGKYTPDGSSTGGTCNFTTMFGQLAYYTDIQMSEPLGNFQNFGGFFSPPTMFHIGPVGAGGGLYSYLFDLSVAPTKALFNIKACPGGIACAFSVFTVPNGGSINIDTSGSGTMTVGAQNLVLSGSSSVTFQTGSPVTIPNLNVLTNNSFNGSAITYTKIGSGIANSTAAFGLCGTYYVANMALCAGVPNATLDYNGSASFYLTNGGVNGLNSIWAESLHGNSVTAYNVIASGLPAQGTITGSYSGTAGNAHKYDYYIVPFVNGVIGTANGAAMLELNAGVPLDASDTVTLTCSGVTTFPTGGIVHVIRVHNSGNDATDLGTCGSGIIDSGQGVPYGSGYPTGATGIVNGAEVMAGSIMGFSSNPASSKTILDAAFSRLGVKSMALGNGTPGDTSGSLSLATVNLTSTTAPTAAAGAVYYDTTTQRIGSCSGTTCSPVALRSESYRYVGAITTTGASTQTLTVTGLTTAGHCTPTQTGTSGTVVGVLLSYTTNTVTLFNPSAATGASFDIACIVQ